MQVPPSPPPEIGDHFVTPANIQMGRAIGKIQKLVFTFHCTM